jgi:hypothetical protein
MKRIVALAIALALALGLGFLVPRALGAEPLSHSGRVLVSTQGDVTIPAGDQADVVVVVNGNANVQGVVNTLVVVEGTATLTGATAETVVAVRSSVEIGPGTVVYGEVQRLDATVHQTGTTDIHGGVVDLSGRWLEIGAVLATALALLWIGFALATLLAGLALAGMGARQVRAAEALITREPALTFVAGILGVIVIPVVAILLLPTVIGAPLGVGILVVVLPLVAFGGYLVAATWLGEVVLRRASPTERVRERPYLAVVLGVFLLGAIGLIPVLNILVAVASLFGFGAVLLLGLRTLLGSVPTQLPTANPAPLTSGA